MSKKSKEFSCPKEEYVKYNRYNKYDKPVPVTPNHEKYHNLLKDKSKKIVICNGWAGTSKSISAIYYACQSVLNGESKGIVLVKELYDGSGFLPGTEIDKWIPKVKQLLTYIECFMQCDYRTLLEDETVVIQPLTYLQGTDYTGYIMVVDEAELISPEMMYCICSRGANRIFINGDTSPLQANEKLAKVGKSGLSFLLETMSKSTSIGIVTMDSEEDIVRDGYIKEIIIKMQPALEEFKTRKRS